MDAIDPRNVYLLIEEHLTRGVNISAEFWDDLMSGNPKTDEARAVAGTSGAMLSAFDMDSDWTSWEIHPAGDEILVLLKGEAEFLLELPEGVRRVHVKEGECCVVPKGVWHTADIRKPCRLLALTPGKGTDHRPRQAQGYGAPRIA
jgi:mannose-6-phosphate isomerase-like protein (cupin superfamily)